MVGNYYIEARTRDNKRTDIIIDYKGKQFVIELETWRGNEYNQQSQTADFMKVWIIIKRKKVIC